MSIEQALMTRSGSVCELCESDAGLTVYPVMPSDGSADQSALVCTTCHDQLTETTTLDAAHWRCLSGCLWSPEPAVQVLAYRQLKCLSAEGWAQDLLDSVFLEPELQTWVDTLSDQESDASQPVDSNGTLLQAGDTVTLIKDLTVKGAGFTAKRGTTVKQISVTDDPALIEGRVNGVRIVLKTCFLKKA